MLEQGRLNPATNLQYGVAVAAEDDVFLSATDGVWDTLDPVQVRLPCPMIASLCMQSLAAMHLTWQRSPPAEPW